MNEPGLLVADFAGPLEPTISRNKHALTEQAPPHRRLLQDRVQAGIDHRRAFVPFRLVALEQPIYLIAAIAKLVHDKGAGARRNVIFQATTNLALGRGDSVQDFDGWHLAGF